LDKYSHKINTTGMLCGVALDVSGSVNATSIATGGSTAKQFDCGTSSFSSGSKTISFAFTFTHTPIVVAGITASYASAIIYVCNVTSVTTTGFTVYASLLVNNTYSTTSSDNFSWIAVG